MLAAVVEGGGVRAQADAALPEAPAGWVVVHVTLAGVCATDLALLDGYKGGFAGIPGHEFVGVVATPAGERVAGERVVGEINARCGTCAVCLGGGPRARNHCPQRKCLGILGLPGAFARQLALPAANLVPVPAGVSDRAAVFAEPLGAACRILEQLDLASKQDRALELCVVGDGKLGLLVAAVLLLRAPQQHSLTVVGRHAAKMRRLEALGRPVRCVVGRAGMAEDAFDVVVEVTGTPVGLGDAVALCRPLGTLVLKSTCASKAPADPGECARRLEAQSAAQTMIVVKELTVVGSRCGPLHEAVALLEREAKLRELLDGLVEETFHLQDVQAAVSRARERGALKVLLDCATPASGPPLPASS